MVSTEPCKDACDKRKNSGLGMGHSCSPIVVVDGDECIVHVEPARLARVGAKSGQQREEGSGLLQEQRMMLNHALDDLQAGHLCGFIPLITRNAHYVTHVGIRR